MIRYRVLVQGENKYHYFLDKDDALHFIKGIDESRYCTYESINISKYRRNDMMKTPDGVGVIAEVKLTTELCGTDEYLVETMKYPEGKWYLEEQLFHGVETELRNFYISKIWSKKRRIQNAKEKKGEGK